MDKLTSCYHCGLPAPLNFSAEIKGQQQHFCCVGCQSVALFIGARGFGDFYQFRDGKSAKPEQTLADFSAFDLPEVQEDFVVAVDGDQNRAQLFLVDVRCAACVWLIENTLQTLPGITDVRVNSSSQIASVQYCKSKVSLSKIFNVLASIGYRPQPLLAHTQQAHWQKQHKDDLLRLGVAGIGMMQAGMVAIALYAGGIQGIEPQWQQLLRFVSLILTLPVVAYSALPFFQNAIRAVSVGRLNMDVPVSIALILAFSASAWATLSGGGEVYFDSVAMFTFLLLLGRFLEQRARRQNLNARYKRMQLLPLTAELIFAGRRKTIPLKQLQVGQILWVAPGCVVPADGELTAGTSELDESVLTGESAAIVKSVGDRVIAGSLNGSTGIEMVVRATGKNTQLAAIERLVNDAQLKRPARVALADKIASHFVAAVLIIALVVGGVWWWLDATKALWVVLSVLVVTCPCALGLATPAALTAALNRLRDIGVLVTGANTLEAVNKIQTVVFDKTGTLTEGHLQLVEVKPLADISEKEVVQIAAALEHGSSHPIARAFKHLHVEDIASQLATELGAGISGTVKGVSYRLGTASFASPAAALNYPGPGLWILLANATTPLAWFKLMDTLRDSAAKAIQLLQAQGKECILLSGDRAENVIELAAQLGIEHAQGGMLPADKLAVVSRLQEQGKNILMVGDGINDAPVLAAANVSAAMGSATEFAQNNADCVLLGDDLTALSQLVRVCARTKIIIQQNLCWAVIYNLTALPLAVCGLVPPWAAAIGMSMSSLVVVLNALRLSRS